MKDFFYRTYEPRRPWHRRRQIERRLAVRPFSGNAHYHAKKSLRRDRRQEQR